MNAPDPSPLLADACGHFLKRYGKKPETVAFAPGRVNLIGGHTDYNQGLALPIAIHQRIYTLACPRKDGQVHAQSLQVGQPVKFSLEDRRRMGRWDDALRGAIAQIARVNPSFSGADLLFTGDMLLEAGLSSSAAFVVSSVLALADLAGIRMPLKELALTAQRVENEFMGVQCGILDQMASALGRADHALLLDCRDLTTRHIRIAGSFAIMVCHTGVTRSLATSKYNERRAECAEGLACIKEIYPDIKSLRDVSQNQVHELSNRLGPVVTRRLLHILRENRRVVHACEALEAGDAHRMGDLMNESHFSLRDDYEVSCQELDVMTELANQTKGCYGARLVGAGFGGCAIALVDPKYIEDFSFSMNEHYLKRTGIQGTFSAVLPGAGAQILKSDRICG